MKPDFAIYLDGTKLQPEEAAAVLGIRVFQTRNGASAFEIVVSDPDLKWQGKPLFTDCKEVKIELGVPGKLKKIFDGEVTAWRTELERSGPTVIVLRGLDRSHRLMRGHKTRTYAQATPLDVARKIAGEAGFTAKVSGGSVDPVKMFRFQANESDFNFLRKMADLEGYLFWIDGQDLHFERPTLSSTDDCTFSFGEDLKTFLPSANFRKPATKVEVGAWDPDGKAGLTGKAASGDELWTVPGGSAGAGLAKFSGTKPTLNLVESQVATQDHADTVAKAALTRRNLEFITAEVEVQGDPAVKPGAMVNIKKVGVYSGHYLVTEANHFYDAGGYACIFYVARDKWGDSSNDQQKKKQAKGGGGASGGGAAGGGAGRGGPGGGGTGPHPSTEPKVTSDKKEFIDFTLQDEDGNPLGEVAVKIHLGTGETLEAKTDGSGRVHLDEEAKGSYTVELAGPATQLTYLELQVIDPKTNWPVAGATGSIKLSDGTEHAVLTDANGEVRFDDVPTGEYTFKLDAPAAPTEPGHDPADPGTPDQPDDPKQAGS